ncbi:MAG: hypothetical protein R3F62_05505 [Planctomycetota bacterium]
MSQTYVIKVSASVREEVSASDKRRKKLVLTEICDPDEQRSILKERLQERGWTEAEGSDGKRWTKSEGGVTQTLDLEDMSVEAEVTLERVLERERTITVVGDRDRDDPNARRTKERTELEERIAIKAEEKQQVEEALQEEIAETLDRTEEERTKELNEVVREVYAESLKRKARRLGSVTEVREGQSGQDYELVIKITE